MKTPCVLGFVAVLMMVVSVHAQAGTCGGACTSTDKCAVDSLDFNCRCSYFTCQMIPPGSCGGGCTTDSQCSLWANGDDNCVCGILFECVNKSQLLDPGYQIYTKFIEATQGDALKKKIAQLKKDHAELGTKLQLQ